MKWALIILGNYTQKLKISNYNYTESGIVIITSVDGQKYITNSMNVLLSDKEPVLKTKKTN